MRRKRDEITIKKGTNESEWRGSAALSLVL